MIKLKIAGAYLFFSLAITPAKAAYLPERLEQIASGLDATLLEVENHLAKNQPVTTRDLSNGALAWLIRKGDSKKAELWLSKVLDVQNMDSHSPNYGALPWSLGNDKVQDENSIEFGTQAWGPILIRYEKLLSRPFLEKLRQHVPAAIAALKRHTSPQSAKTAEVSYTNIYLMNSSNLLLLGQATHSQEASSAGKKQILNWLQYTAHEGIHEFVSPTYYAVDLTALSLAYGMNTDQDFQSKLRGALDYFWLDISANFFPGRMSLSGAHSRDYDFLRGRGGALLYPYLEGLSDNQETEKIDLEKAELVEAFKSPHAYHPSAKTLQIAASPERWIAFHWSPKRVTEPSDRWNYITSDFSVSSSNADYGPQDKPIVWELASTPQTPVIALIPDIYDNPYGKVKLEDKDGHKKPKHVPLHPSAVQNKGTLLVALDLDSTHEDATSSFATNIVLPNHLDSVLWNGAKVNLLNLGDHPGSVDSILAVRQGNACLGFRIFEADSVEQKAATLSLKADPPGALEGAARLAIEHYRGNEKKLGNKHVRVGILSIAKRCKTEDEVKVLVNDLRAWNIQSNLTRINGKDQGWEISALPKRAGDASLTIKRNLSKRVTFSRTINGREVDAPRFLINGEDPVKTYAPNFISE